MKLAGHTMATPELTVEESIAFFSSLNLDGVEIVIQTDYRCGIPYEASDAELRHIRQLVDSCGMQVCCVTPYYSNFNSLDEAVREASCRGMKRVIEMAHILGAPSIRTYGGSFADTETDKDGRKLGQLVRSLRECGDYAAKFDTYLAVENHFGTMTTTAKKTMEVIEEVSHPRVGVLYDQANLAFFPAEEYEEAIPMQREHIRHVHVKDLVYKGGKPSRFQSDKVWHISEDIRTVSSRIPGDGILDWTSILSCLKTNGYNGWLSLEYERRWGNQDLPLAEEGMPIAVRRIRECMEHISI